MMQTTQIMHIDARASRLPRVLAGLLVILAVGVAIAMIVLRPDGAALDGLGPDSRLPDTELARVVATSEVDCQVPSAKACLEATIELKSGPDAGERFELILGEAGAQRIANVGDRVRVVASMVPDDAQIGGFDVPPYAFNDFERRAPLGWLVALFGAIVLVAGRWHGLRSLIGLIASLGVVVWFIIPALLSGSAPLVVAVVGAFAVMLLVIPLSHGIGPVTVAASLGTAVSLLLTLALALTFTRLAHISGFSGDEVAYLHAYLGDLSLQGLLLAGIIISALGVLDDVTVSQASTVMALRRANPNMPFARLVREAMHVGRDHIAATVNTLVLAYVGASLPVLLVFSLGQVGAGDAFNSEAVAAQVVATLCGSIGLIAAMPITTMLAALLATRMHAGQLEIATAHAHTHAHD